MTQVLVSMVWTSSLYLADQVRHEGLSGPIFLPSFEPCLHSAWFYIPAKITYEICLLLYICIDAIALSVISLKFCSLVLDRVNPFPNNKF